MAKAAGRLRSSLGVFFLLLVPSLIGPGAAIAQPNVILFLVDDQGWTDTSVSMDPSVPDSMSDYHETPRLEALAAEGTRFSAAYAPAPICSPSRVSIETGLSPASLQVTNNIETGIPPARMTIPEIIKAERPEYGTAHFGKWHEAWGSTPGDHGYEQHNGGLPYPTPGHDPLTNPKDVEAITQLAETFIEAQVASGNPFYLVVSHHAVHVPLTAFPATVDYYLQKPSGTRHTDPVYAALTDDLDTALGRILDKLNELQIKDETYLIYMSDNGGHVSLTSNLPLRDGKGTLWEGGVRVPFVVSGPGVIAGRVETEKPAVGWDLMPTILDWIGVTHALPPDAEGESLRSALEGTAGGGGCTSADDRTLVWHSPHKPSPHSTIRRQTCAGTYKLISFWSWPASVELYDLGSDLAETLDLSDSQPQLAADLEQDLSAYLAQVGLPCPNQDSSLGPLCPAPKPRCGLGYELPLLLLPFLLWRRRSERATPAT
jgi:arylsulfatase A-like enzyme